MLTLYRLRQKERGEVITRVDWGTDWRRRLPSSLGRECASAVTAIGPEHSDPTALYSTSSYEETNIDNVVWLRERERWYVLEDREATLTADGQDETVTGCRLI